MESKFPEVTVKLSENDGNAFLIIGRVVRALKYVGATKEQCDEFTKEAMSGDYEGVLRTCMKWVNVE
jgi:hypothetical protein